MAGYFSKTNFTPSTSNTYTVSFWVKINNFAPTSSNVPYLWSISDSDTSGLFFQADTTPYNITFFRSNGSARFSPTNYMRDVNAWYHVHLKVSSGTGTLYYNGESVKTSITVDAQNYNGGGAEHYIHTYGSGLTDYDNLECVMSHFHFVDGTAYEPTVFGSTDSTTGEWKINTSPSVTYGTNGYFILKDGNTGTDHSGNGNNFTLTGTCTKTEDCPSNVFCTYNPLQQTNGSTSISLGNNYFTNGTQWLGVNGTIAATSGKYYAEFKVTGTTGWGVGVADVDSDANRTDILSSTNNGYQSKYTGGKQIYLNGSTIIAQENNSTVVNNAGMGNTSFAANDIVMVALDLDNNNLFFGKNGTWLRGATESEIEAGTSTNATFTGTSFNNKFWTWSVCSEQENMYMNAGNGYFGTTAVSSAGTNASGIGIFEYDVPAGYTALSTKGLNL